MPVLLIRTADGNFRLTELNGSTYSLASEPQEAATFMSSANVELVTVTRNNHGFIDGQLVNIESANLTNGQYNINFVDANSFTYTPPANEGTHINEACTVGRGFSVPQWDDALVGDDVTNPEPSFIGKGISKMLFFSKQICNTF